MTSYDLNAENHRTATSSTAAEILSGTFEIREEDIGITADLALHITNRKGGGFNLLLFGPAVKSINAHNAGISRHPKNDILTLVQDCRRAWEKAVVCLQRQHPSGKPPFFYPFQVCWDFSEEKVQSGENFLSTAMPSLAVAGEELYRRIFERECDENLKKLSDALRSLLRSCQRNIAITSNEFFLPWGMLYTHPIAGESLEAYGKNWRKEGFWGYQHTIWHNPENIDVKFKIRPNGRLLSINFDDRLATALQLPIIDEHVQEIVALGGGEESTPARRRKAELRDAFAKDRDSLERILYFYCHGHGSMDNSGSSSSQPCLILSDGEQVCARDLNDWADGKLPTSPLVFINACQGGQMTTMFYQTFASALLNLGAVGLIGAQIDIPAVFAVEYGKRILSEFLRRPDTDRPKSPSSRGSRPRLGCIMSGVNRRLFDQHRNPLGLVYSLYYGVNCFIDWETAPSPGQAHA